MEGILAPNGMLIQGIVLITGIVGQWYVARMNVRGFYCWAVSNVVLIAVSLHFGGYGMVVLYGYFLVMAGYSILHWGKRQAEERAARECHLELLKIARVFVEFANRPEILQATNPLHDPLFSVGRAKEILMNANIGIVDTQQGPAPFVMAGEQA